LQSSFLTVDDYTFQFSGVKGDLNFALGVGGGESLRYRSLKSYLRSLKFQRTLLFICNTMNKLLNSLFSSHYENLLACVSLCGSNHLSIVIDRSWTWGCKARIIGRRSGLHLLSNSTGMIVRVAAFVIFLSVYKNCGAGCWGALSGEWPTVSRKVI